MGGELAGTSCLVGSMFVCGRGAQVGRVLHAVRPCAPLTIRCGGKVSAPDNHRG